MSILRLDMRAPAFSPASPAELYAAALDMAEYVDGRGFDSVTLSEHHGVDDGFLPAPLPMAGCILGRTRKLRVGVAALLATLYDPVKLAEDLAVLDLASQGRIGVTAGMGYRPEEYESFGKDWHARGKRLDEVVEVLLQAWTGEPFEYRGHTLRVTPKPFTRPHPTLFIGGQSKAGARRAARFGLPYQPATNDAEMIQLYLSECERRGVANPLVLPPGSGEMLWVSEDPDRTWSEIGPYLLHDAETYASWQPSSQRSVVHSLALDVAGLRAEGKYRVLTPDECVARAQQQGPLAVFILFPLCGGTPPDLAWPSVQLYTEEVLPRIGEERERERPERPGRS